MHGFLCDAKDGKYALASLWDMDGALIICDAVTLKEVKRLPMKKPVGKYNVWNMITKSEGTSYWGDFEGLVFGQDLQLTLS